MSLVICEKIDKRAELPFYATEGAAGMDLKACLDEPVVIHKNSHALIPTGLKMKISTGFEGQIRPRSGLALKKGITVLNSPATIDSDYRGPVGIILYNYTSSDFTVEHGDRIAQLVINEVYEATIIEGKVEDDTLRGDGGFGSTGK